MDNNAHAYITDNLTNTIVFPLWNDKSLDVIDRYFSKEADIRTTFISGRGRDILKKSVEDTFEIFPNLAVNINDVVHNGNKHIYKWQAIGSHARSTMGMPATGQEIQFSGVVYGEIEHGLITTYHSFSNIPQVLQELYSFRQVEAANGDGMYADEHSCSQNSNGSLFFDIYQAIRKLANFPLTRREVECLGAWIKGCTIKETAKRMGGLSERTIQTYRESIKKKFGVYNYQQVLYIIKNNGLLPHLL